MNELPEVLCDECGGAGEFERVIGERQGMGGIEPIVRTYACEDCDDGLARCQECGDSPSYQEPSFDRLCSSCLAEALKEAGA